jgi:hypothetical protein
MTESENDRGPVCRVTLQAEVGKRPFGSSGRKRGRTGGWVKGEVVAYISIS